MLSGGSGHGDAQVRLALREVQRPSGVGKHGGERLTRVQPSLVHLGDVRDEVRLDTARLHQDLRQAPEESVVGDRR